MKIILVIASLEVGGTEQKVIRLANYFAEQGNDVEILSLSLNNSQKILINRKIKISIIDTNSNLKARLLAKNKVFNYLKKLQYETLITPVIFYFNYYPALFLSKKLSKQYVFINTTHLIGFSNKIKQKIAINKMKHANAVVMGNTELAIQLKKIPQLKNTKIDVLQNGIDTDCPFKEYYGINEIIKLIIVARLRPEKRHLDIFKAVKILTDKGFQIELDCIGSEVLNGQEASLVQLTDELYIKEKVNFLGDQNNVRQILPNYDVFVLASNDTFSNALLEAMAAGLPVLCANAGGAPEIVDNLKDGLLYEFKNPNDLADKLEFLIKSEILRKTIGTNAIIKIKNNFSSDSMYKKYERYLYD